MATSRSGCAPKMPSGAGFSATRQVVKEHRLSTVCEESDVPEHR